jgi:hypothetical protein
MQWVVIIGEEASGRALVSFIVGAHYNVRLSNGERYVSKWHQGVIEAQQIVPLLLQKGYCSSSKEVNYWASLNKHNDPLLCVGDSCVDDVVRLVRQRRTSPDVLQRFSSAVGLPVKVVHVVRNPVQTITTWVQDLKYLRLWGDHPNQRAQIAIRRYTKFYNAAQSIFDKQGSVFHLPYEDLIFKPTETLIGLFNYLELPQDKGYRAWVIRKQLPRKIVMPEANLDEQCYKSIQTMIDSFDSLRFEYGQ